MGEEGGDLVGVGGLAAGAARPGHDPTRFPRELQPDDAGDDRLLHPGLVLAGAILLGGFLAWPLGLGRAVGQERHALLAGEASERGGQLPVRVLGVGDDLVALLAPQRTRRREVLVGVEEQAQERGAPRDLVGLEDVELFGRGFVLGLELHVEIEGRLVDA